MDTIAGTAWVHMKSQTDGPDLPSPVTRIRFNADGTADYTASSLSMMYPYTCTRQGGLLACVETDTHYKEWCRAWAASHDGVCDPALLAPVIGGKPEDMAAAAAEVNAEFKAAKGEARAQLMKDYNNQNNKIRGKLRVALNAGVCQLTIEDKFQAMADGRVMELENSVSNAKFSKTTEVYAFEKCEDLEAARTIVPEGATARAYPPGSFDFESFLPAGQRADSSCTYTADIWTDWLKTQPGLAGTVEKGNVRWAAKAAFAEDGPHVVYFDRSKDCGGKKDRIGFSCAKVHIKKAGP
jgi:hypothetical protein